MRAEPAMLTAPARCLTLLCVLLGASIAVRAYAYGHPRRPVARPPWRPRARLWISVRAHCCRTPAPDDTPSRSAPARDRPS